MWMEGRMQTPIHVADAVVGVLLRDSEVMDALPVESFDRPVGLIVTEARTIRTPYLAE